MDMPVDASVILPAAFFTLLAVIVAAVVLRRKECPAASTSTQRSRDVSGNTHEEECELPRPLEALRPSRERQTDTDCPQEFQERLSDKDTESQCTADADQDLEEKLCESEQTTVGSKGETTVEPANVPSDHEEKPLRYKPGMLRTSQLEKMMSKEELDEERRVQQEQLAAIFKLLKENQDTFGEVTEKDMEEQLKLYSI